MQPFSLLRISCLLLCLTGAVSVSAERFYKDNDDYFRGYLQQRRYDLDPSANAIVLYEKGTTELTREPYGGTYTVRTVHRVVQVLLKNGLSQGDVTVQARSTTDRAGEIRKIRCVTYNMEGGKLVRQEMPDGSIQKTKTDGLVQARFSAAAVREGSIIDYTYTVKEDFMSLLFAEWAFQDKIPCLYSELEVYMPANLDFAVLNQGIPPFPELDDSRKSLENNQLPLIYCNEKLMPGNEVRYKRWIRRQVPAAYEEPFMGSLENYRQKIQLKISGVRGAAFSVGVLDTWPKLNKALLEDFNFYKATTLKYQNVLEQTKALTAGLTDDLDKAKAIYRYVRSTITSNDKHTIYAFKALDKVLQERSGSPAEINLLLTTMLRYAGLSAEPVILGTRDLGRALSVFPVMDRFNYTVAELKAGGITCYLDASDPLNPFGILPAECYNGFCWKVDGKGQSLNLEPEQLREKGLITVSTLKADPNDYQLEFRQHFGSLAGAEKRAAWRKDTTLIRKYILATLKGLPEAALHSYEVKALQDPETNLQVQYVVSLKWPAAGTAMYLNPVMGAHVSSNPFKASTRNYPVEMPSAVDYTYSLKLKLPDGYGLEDAPKSAEVRLDDKDAYKYLVDYNKEERLLQLNTRIQMSRATFTTEEYDLLQQFFEKIVEHQQLSCTVKKQS